MKKFKLLYFVALVALFTSCEKEDPIDPIIGGTQITQINKNDGLPKGGNTALELRFEIKTAQDQMGDFAENAMLEFNGKVWSFGGVNTYGATDGHYAWYSDNGIHWVSSAITPSTLTTFRRGHTVTLFNDELYLIGGEDASGLAYGDIWKSSDGANWTNVYAVAPFGAIPEHATLVHNDKMFVIAGNRATTNTEVWSTENGSDWVQETSNAFPGRAGQKGIVFNNAMYIIGGENSSGTKLNEVWRSTDGISWSQISDVPFVGRNAHSVTEYDNKVWVIGGKDASSDYNGDIWFSENMTDWTEYSGARPSDEGMHSHTILNYEGKLWLFGGYQDDGGEASLRGEISTIEID